MISSYWPVTAAVWEAPHESCIALEALKWADSWMRVGIFTLKIVSPDLFLWFIPSWFSELSPIPNSFPFSKTTTTKIKQKKAKRNKNKNNMFNKSSRVLSQMLQTDWLLYSLSIPRYLVSIKVECRTHAPYQRVYTRGKGNRRMEEGARESGENRTYEITHLIRTLCACLHNLHQLSLDSYREKKSGLKGEKTLNLL